MTCSLGAGYFGVKRNKLDRRSSAMDELKSTVRELGDRDPHHAGASSARVFALDGVRRDNLATVLRLLHHGAIAGRSRSELTRSTGLNRSTISDLVSELAEHRLVEIEPPARRVGVGRPSPVVRVT